MPYSRSPLYFLALFALCLTAGLIISGMLNACSVRCFMVIFACLLSVHYFSFLLWIRGGIKISADRKIISSEKKFVSVIVPFRNEESVIAENAASIINQNYSPENYEIIYVDDNSEDGSCEIIAGLRSGLLRFISISGDDKYGEGKKAALKKGIDNARGEIIISADADCIYPPCWLETLIMNMDEDTGFIAGPVYYTPNGSLFGEMQQLEFAGLVLTGAGLIGRGLPTIANGANAAYRRDLFYSAGGFHSAENLTSGDDELVMRKIHSETEFAVAFCFDSGAAVAAKPSAGIREFFKQRRRWASKSLFYDPLLLAGVLLPSFLFFLLFTTLMLLLALSPELNLFLILLLIFLVKAFGEYMVLKAGRSIFNFTIRPLPLALTVLLHPVYIVYSTLAGVLLPFTWKERTVKK